MEMPKHWAEGLPCPIGVGQLYPHLHLCPPIRIRRANQSRQCYLDQSHCENLDSSFAWKGTNHGLGRDFSLYKPASPVSGAPWSPFPNCQTELFHWVVSAMTHPKLGTPIGIELAAAIFSWHYCSFFNFLNKNQNSTKAHLACAAGVQAQLALTAPTEVPPSFWQTGPCPNSYGTLRWESGQLTPSSEEANLKMWRPDQEIILC